MTPLASRLSSAIAAAPDADAAARECLEIVATEFDILASQTIAAGDRSATTIATVLSICAKNLRAAKGE